MGFMRDAGTLRRLCLLLLPRHDSRGRQLSSCKGVMMQARAVVLQVCMGRRCAPARRREGRWPAPTGSKALQARSLSLCPEGSLSARSGRGQSNPGSSCMQTCLGVCFKKCIRFCGLQWLPANSMIHGDQQAAVACLREGTNHITEAGFGLKKSSMSDRHVPTHYGQPQASVFAGRSSSCGAERTHEAGAQTWL